MPGKTEAPSSSHFQECPPSSLSTRWLHPRISLAHLATETQLDQDPPACTSPAAKAEGKMPKLSFPTSRGKVQKVLIFSCLFFLRGTCFLLHLQNYFQRVLPTFSSHLSKSKSISCDLQRPPFALTTPLPQEISSLNPREEQTVLHFRLRKSYSQLLL